MTKSDPYHNDYECPECSDDVEVPLPVAKYVTCPTCNSKLVIHVDAEFDRGMWHDRTTLSVLDEREQHIKRMLKHLTEDNERAFDGEDAEEWQRRSENDPA